MKAVRGNVLDDVDKRARDFIADKYRNNEALMELFCVIWEELRKRKPDVKCIKTTRYLSLKTCGCEVFARVDAQARAIWVGIYCSDYENWPRKDIFTSSKSQWSSRGLRWFEIMAFDENIVDLLEHCYDSADYRSLDESYERATKRDRRCP